MHQEADQFIHSQFVPTLRAAVRSQYLPKVHLPQVGISNLLHSLDHSESIHTQLHNGQRGFLSNVAKHQDQRSRTRCVYFVRYEHDHALFRLEDYEDQRLI